MITDIPHTLRVRVPQGLKGTPGRGSAHHVRHPAVRRLQCPKTKLQAQAASSGYGFRTPSRVTAVPTNLALTVPTPSSAVVSRPGVARPA